MKADKKQLLLRLSPTLYESLTRMAEEDFRSLNGEIEYLLTQAANKKYGVKKTAEAPPAERAGSFRTT